MKINQKGIGFGEWYRLASWGRKVPLRMDVARMAWAYCLDASLFACK